MPNTKNPEYKFVEENFANQKDISTKVKETYTYASTEYYTLQNFQSPKMETKKQDVL